MRKRIKRRVSSPWDHPSLQPTGNLAVTDLADLQLRELLALDALTKAQGCRMDLRDLLVSAAVARELAALGYGADELPGLDAADAVLLPLKALPTGAIGLAAPEAVQAIRWLLTYHHAQRTAATRRDYLRSLAKVQAEPSRYGIWRA